jgi:hypothetical protein
MNFLRMKVDQSAAAGAQYWEIAEHRAAHPIRIQNNTAPNESHTIQYCADGPAECEQIVTSASLDQL